MAAHYIREIKSVQGVGPYYLGGYCLGGAIALEMAQQLKDQGEQVALVAMFETYNSKAVLVRPSRWLPLYRSLQNANYHFENLLLTSPEDRRQFSREKWNVARERLRIRLDALAHALGSNRGSENGSSHAHLRVKKVNDRAMVRYRPRPYSGRVVLFRPKEHFRGLDDPQFGWGGVIGPKLEICNLPFYPKGMMVEPFVRILAGELDRRLSAEDKGKTIKEMMSPAMASLR